MNLRPCAKIQQRETGEDRRRGLDEVHRRSRQPPDELITPETRNQRVRGGDGTKSAANRRYCDISSGVTKLVVDPGEVVEVQDEDHASGTGCS